MDVLYDHAVKRIEYEHRFQAAIHGIDLSESSEEKIKTEVKQGVVFGDPKDYKDMPQEERQELTKKLMAKFGGMRVGGQNV